MALNTNFRELYTSAYNGKNSSKELLTKRYLDVIGRINGVYDSVEKDIERQYEKHRNSASAQGAINKNNTASMLVQKGLSKSGESVQNAVLQDMALANTMTELASDEAQKISANNQNRINEIASVERELIKAQNEADREEREMEYQRERDKVKDEQWKNEFDYNASRANISDYKWEKEREYQKERDKESDRQWNVSHAYKREQDSIERDRKERELAYKIHESDRNYALAREELETQSILDREELELKKTTAANENYIKSQYLAIEKQNSGNKNTSSKKTDGVKYTVNDEGYYVPEISANYLLNIIQKNSAYGTWVDGRGYIGPKQLFKERLLEIMGNPDLDPDYLADLTFYAKARGVLE